MTDHPLTKYRKRQGLTVAAFAAKAGISRSYVSLIECRQRLGLGGIRAIEAATSGEVTASDLIAAKFGPKRKARAK
jgi:transcriptional regulator with XRE-family HTH domain